MTHYIVAIETSCDDTSIAILKNDIVLSCVTKDSIKDLESFSGIVPEIASRKHEEYILSVFDDAIVKANISINDITDICYTNEPGLPGSLHVGEIFAKTLGYMLNIEPHPINHIHAHIFSSFINKNSIEYPFISLIASGKTTSIFVVHNPYKIEEIIKTDDDAIGETFDKISKMLGYGYPGGPVIDQMYDESKATLKFPIQQIERNFSFSGIKSHIARIIDTNKKNKTNIDDITIMSSFMQWGISTLIKKLEFYKNKFKVNVVTIGGGVASNSLFKKEIKKIFKNSYVPEKEYACDNAAMIGFLYFKQIAYKKKG